MLPTIAIVVLLLVLIVVLKKRHVISFWYAVALGVISLGGARGIFEWNQQSRPSVPGKSAPVAPSKTSLPPPPEDLTKLPPVSSETCMKCHASQFESWKQTFHRTMTREATPENVKGDFNDAVMTYNGVESRMTRKGDRFYIDTVDPVWEEQVLSRGISVAEAGPMVRTSISVDRVVGSHWFQQAFRRSQTGRYVRLPLVYHIVEKRWIHINGAFLQPSSPKFFSYTTIWNSTCLYCHNTRPVGNPFEIPNDRNPGYHTTVGELGIACEACHGAGDYHVRTHQNLSADLARIGSKDADPTIVNPARLPVSRSDDVCARCHGAPLGRISKWNRDTMADPFLAGGELDRTWHVCWSETEMEEHSSKEHINRGIKKGTGEIDGRFWEDGTPLTTALEYQSLALSKCYQDGKGTMRCLTCHSMHQSDPNHQLKDGMRTNAACYSCHETYRTRLVEHTHHAEDSPGSQCMNCHMPHHVYSLLDTHRSHRIMVPRVRDSLNTGKLHACNLCHLDKSLGWTSDQLQKWYDTKPEPLSEEDRRFASSLLHLTRRDARSRAIVASAFGNTAAQKASGSDWPGLLLTRALEQERYEAIRYLLHRALRSLYGPSASEYNYQGSAAERAAQISLIEQRLHQRPQLNRQNYPELPLNEQGRFTDVVDRWLKTRNDPDVYIKE